MAKPCSNCLSEIKKIGVRYVYYTTFKGFLNRELARDMTNDHLSSLDSLKAKK